MIKYKITTVFQPEWKNVFEAVFPGKQHDESRTYNDHAVVTFNDSTVTPVDLGPLVKVEIIPNP